MVQFSKRIVTTPWVHNIWSKYQGFLRFSKSPCQEKYKTICWIIYYIWTRHAFCSTYKYVISKCYIFSKCSNQFYNVFFNMSWSCCHFQFFAKTKVEYFDIYFDYLMTGEKKKKKKKTVKWFRILFYSK